MRLFPQPSQQAAVLEPVAREVPVSSLVCFWLATVQERIAPVSVALSGIVPAELHLVRLRPRAIFCWLDNVHASCGAVPARLP